MKTTTDFGHGPNPTNAVRSTKPQASSLEDHDVLLAGFRLLVADARVRGGEILEALDRTRARAHVASAFARLAEVLF